MQIFKSIHFIILVNVLFSVIYCVIEPVRNPFNTGLFLSIVLLHLIYSLITIYHLKNSIINKRTSQNDELPKNIRIFTKSNYILKISLIRKIWIILISSSATLSKKHLVMLFLLSRIAILPMLPWLSDDVFTYLWQGKLTSMGINVYTQEPESIKWKEYQNEVFNLMGNRNIPAIYPPLTVVINGTVHKIANIFSDDWKFEYYLWKLLLLISEFIAFLLFINLVNKTDYIYPLIYSVLPLSIIEISGQGHNDGLIFVFLALLLYLLNKTLNPTHLNSGNINKIITNILIGFQIALLILIKIIPIAFFAVVLKMKIKPFNKYLIILSCFVVIIGISLPFFLDFRAIEIFRNGQEYYNMVASFNSLPLIISRFLLKYFNIADWWIAAPYLVQIFRMSALLIAFIIIKPISKSSVINSLILFYLIPILISSKVHTWYFAPVIFLSIYNKNIALAFALQIFLFSYHYYLFIDKSIIPYMDLIVWIIVIAVYYNLKQNKYCLNDNSIYNSKLNL